MGAAPRGAPLCMAGYPLVRAYGRMRIAGRQYQKSGGDTLPAPSEQVPHDHWYLFIFSTETSFLRLDQTFEYIIAGVEALAGEPICSPLTQKTELLSRRLDKRSATTPSTLTVSPRAEQQTLTGTRP